MKTKHFYLLAVMGLAILSCDKGGNKAPIDEPPVVVPPAVVPAADENTGTYKIEFEINSDKDVRYNLAFAGGAGKEPAGLYDGDGNFKYSQWIFSNTSANKPKVACYTDSRADFLFSTIVIPGVEGGTTGTYSLKAFYNEKLVREIKKEINLAGQASYEFLNFSTNGRDNPEEGEGPPRPKNTGTRKIEFEINSDKNVEYEMKFSGVYGREGELLYDGDGNPVPYPWDFSSTSSNKPKVTRYTNDKADDFSATAYIKGVDGGATVTCVLKAYYNEKLVREMKREIKLADRHTIEGVQIF